MQRLRNEADPWTGNRSTKRGRVPNRVGETIKVGRISTIEIHRSTATNGPVKLQILVLHQANIARTVQQCCASHFPERKKKNARFYKNMYRNSGINDIMIRFISIPFFLSFPFLFSCSAHTNARLSISDAAGAGILDELGVLPESTTLSLSLIHI